MADGGMIHAMRGGMAWLAELTRGEKGPHPTASNAVLMLCHEKELVGLLAYDEFAHRVVLTREPPEPYVGGRRAPGPYPRPATDTDISLIQMYIQRVCEIRISIQIAQQAADTAAQQHRTHPVREWLATLQWDGRPRVDTWLSTAFGTPTDAYHRAVGRKFLAAAVRRIRVPGTKFDAMPVLEGAQELGKSESCRALFGAQWFSDELPDMRNREAPLSMLGMWGVEISELGPIIRTEIEVVKAFLSRRVDRYREMHGRRYEDRPRQTMLIGTTNDRDYLRDPTGNRRFWPIWCTKAEHMWIAEIRDQLWAEAVQIEAEGETLWLDDEGVRTTAKRIQAERVAEDTWVHKVRGYIIDGPNGPLADVKVSDLMQHAIGLPSDKQNRPNEMRVAAILRAEGWSNTVVWRNGRSTRLWVPPP